MNSSTQHTLRMNACLSSPPFSCLCTTVVLLQYYCSTTKINQCYALCAMCHSCRFVFCLEPAEGLKLSRQTHHRTPYANPAKKFQEQEKKKRAQQRVRIPSHTNAREPWL